MTPYKDPATAPMPTTTAVRRRAAELGVDLSSVAGTGTAGRVTLRDLPSQSRGDEAHAHGWIDHVRRRRAGEPAATRSARLLAHEQGVDLRNVVGSGPGGQIRGRDLSAAPAIGRAIPGSVVTLTAAQLHHARASVTTLHETAQLTTVMEVDVTAIQADSLIPAAVAAIAQALPAHSALSAEFDLTAGTVTHPEEHTIRVQAPPAAPALVAADPGLTADRAAKLLADRSGQSIGKPTFELTVVAGGALFETPLLPQGSTAVLSLGSPIRRPVVTESDSDEPISIRTIAMLAMTYDHRVIDGADAARFLGDVCRTLSS